jgi:hypothetical protein
MMPFPACQYHQYSADRQHRADDLQTPDGRAKEQPTRSHHLDRHTGPHERHVDRRTALQRKVLQCVVHARSQQTLDGVPLPVPPQLAVPAKYQTRYGQQDQQRQQPA